MELLRAPSTASPSLITVGCPGSVFTCRRHALAYSARCRTALPTRRGITGQEVADARLGARRRSEPTAQPWLAKSRLSWRNPCGR